MLDTPRASPAGSLPRGKVWLVGAGPGDPDLLTLKAYRLLRTAQVVAYDKLVTREILAIAPGTAELICVGRRAGEVLDRAAPLDPQVIERALEGKDVIRLKGGDPLVFGRGGEETEGLARAGVAFEIVPGISAAMAAAAAANIPLTHRDCSSSVTLATGHFSGHASSLAGGLRSETVVFYMAVARIDELCADLIESGRSRDTPAAVVSRATLLGGRVLVGTLDDLSARVRDAHLEAPAVLLVGEVVARRVASPSFDVRSMQFARPVHEVIS